MPSEVYRYVLCRPIPFPDLMATLDLALIAIQSLHGHERARLDARFAVDARKQTLAIDAGTPVGQALNQIFTGFARREFGEHALKIERVSQPVPNTRAESPVGAVA